MNRISKSQYQKGFYIVLVFLSIISTNLGAQSNNLNWEIQRFYLDSFVDNSSVSSFNFDWYLSENYKNKMKELEFPKKNKLNDYLFNSHFLHKKAKDFTFFIDPILDLAIGEKSSEDALVRMSKGFFAIINFKDRLEIGTSIYNGYEKSEKYIEDWTVNNRVFPGFGGAKTNLEYLDYLSSSGYVNYKFSRYAKFSAGHGKNKIGEGYRSLFLSDAVHNYPYLRAEFSLWRFNYTALLAQFTRFDDPINSAGLRKKKNGVFHYLEARILDNLKLSFFESVIWTQDSLGTRGFEFNYLNPFVSLRPVEYALGSPDNMVLGVGGKWVIKDRVKLYGQFVLDEFKLSELSEGNNWWGNKYGSQFGLDVHKLFNVKGLNFIIEYNSVRPFTYSHFDVTQSYSHLKQSLAHPAGANFREVVSFFHYRKKRWLTSLQMNYKEQGFEESIDYSIGQDVNKSYEVRKDDYNNEIGQGINSKQLYSCLKFGYLINTKSNFIFEISYINRHQKFKSTFKNENQLFIGFRTSFYNVYRDF